MKIIQVTLGTHQQSQIRAFNSWALDTNGTYASMDYTASPPEVFRERLADRVDQIQPDMIFMQIQKEGIVTNDLLNSFDCIKVNWTGDIRDEIPTWMIDIAPSVDLTLFSNERDPVAMTNLGFASDFLNIGFEEKYYTRTGKAVRDYPFVFMGNNFADNPFPLCELRRDFIYSIPEISVFGIGWATRGVDNLFERPGRESEIYRGCKAALSISHFNEERYFSDRLLRIMACGALCFSHAYPGIEKDFEPDKDLVTFNSTQEFQHKLAYYVRNKNQADEIADRGCRKVWDNHRWTNRIEELKRLLLKYNLIPSLT